MPRTLAAVSLILVLIAGCVLRAWAAGGDLWIDEIWSLNQMRVAASSDGMGDWLALLFHSNTHPLSTFYMRAVDGWTTAAPSSFQLRLLSLLSGILSLFLIAWWGWKRNPATAIIMTTLFAISYPMINYSGEARGYGPMILAILGASYALERYLKSPTKKTLLTFVLFSLLGLLSHLTFVIVQAGLGFWALAALYSKRRNIISTAAALVPLFGLQLITISAYGSIALDNMVRGGDCCPEPALDSVRIMTDWTFGLDANEVTSLLPLMLLTLLIGFVIFRLVQQKDPAWIALTIIIFAFPLITFIVETKPNVIHRYFLPSAVFALLTVGSVLSRLWQKNGWSRWASALAITLFCLGNVDLLLNFSEAGRGQYSRVIKNIAALSTGPQRISGYPKFSVGELVRHHIEVGGYGDRLRFIERKQENTALAHWYINGYLDGQTPEQSITRGQHPTPFTLVGVYPQWGLSGDTWALYRRLP
jgi:hypothetical protein